MWHDTKFTKSLIWITICILGLVKANEFPSSPFTSYEYTELKCEYDFSTGNQICDCLHHNQGFVLQKITGNLNGLWLRNCKELLIRKNTFRDVGYLHDIRFENIHNLDIESYSLEFASKPGASKVKIVFVDTDLEAIKSYTITGSIDSVKFVRCRIGKINAFSINTHQPVFEISFESSKIDLIESQAFKKLHMEHLRMQDTTVHAPIQVRTFYDLVISNTFFISNCTFSAISSSAFVLKDVNRLLFTYNIIGKIEGEAFQANVAGRILIEHNIFSQFSYLTFSGVRVGTSYKKQQNNQPMEFQFLSNIVHSTDFPIRIVVDRKDFILRIMNLKFTTPINCSYTKQLEHNSFLRQYGDTVYFRFGKSDEDRFQSVSNIMNNTCTLSPATVAIIATSTVLVLILIIAITAVFYRYLMKHQRSRQVNMVIPEGKTHRETQIVFQVENAGLLKTDL